MSDLTYLPLCAAAEHLGVSRQTVAAHYPPDAWYLSAKGDKRHPLYLPSTLDGVLPVAAEPVPLPRVPEPVPVVGAAPVAGVPSLLAELRKMADATGAIRPSAIGERADELCAATGLTADEVAAEIRALFVSRQLTTGVVMVGGVPQQAWRIVR